MPGLTLPWPPARRKLLIACYEVPGFGGASTSAYDLYRSLREDGFDVALLCLIEERDRDFYEYTFGDRLGNPAGLPGVTTYGFTGALRDPQPGLGRIITEIGPDVMLAVGYIAALVLRAAAPERRLAFFTAGSQQAQSAIDHGRAPDAVTLARRFPGVRAAPATPADQERLAVEAADLVIMHSPMILEFFRHFYSGAEAKLYPRVVWMAEWIHRGARRHEDLARPFGARDIDLLFVASTWDRREKNYPLVEAIAAGHPQAVVHVVGDVATRIPGVVHHGFVAAREAMLALLGNARTVVCPSRIDAAPGILFEASALGCNVVASRNCGNWRLCHPDLLVEPYRTREFIEKSARSLTGKFPDQMDAFLRPSSYEDLVETLMVL
jgi:glycosyltransferase involved in cell wall biosynthesis